MTEHISVERMNESLDGIMAAADMELIEAHVADCGACRNEYARLSETVREIRALPREAATPDGTWTAIASRIGAERAADTEDEVPVYRLPTGAGAKRRISFSLPELAAAGIAIALFSAGLMWLAIGGGPEAPGVAVTPGLPGGAAARAVAFHGSQYSEVVGRFEQILADGRTVLRPETLISIEESLATIDEAIAEVEVAIANDPGSELLRRMLATHQRTRLGVLQRAAAAIQAQT